MPACLGLTDAGTELPKKRGGGRGIGFSVPVDQHLVPPGRAARREAQCVYSPCLSSPHLSSLQKCLTVGERHLAHGEIPAGKAEDVTPLAELLFVSSIIPALLHLPQFPASVARFGDSRGICWGPGREVWWESTLWEPVVVCGMLKVLECPQDGFCVGKVCLPVVVVSQGQEMLLTSAFKSLCLNAEFRAVHFYL